MSKKYRGVTTREAHPKIFIFSHTDRAEIEYFNEFKNFLQTPLLMPIKNKCWTPQELIQKVIKWKKKKDNGYYEEDGDQIWCIFDIDDFYKKDPNGFMRAISDAHKNNIKIALINECFELWIIFHFIKPTSSISRKDMEDKIIELFKKNNLGKFQKNQQVFSVLYPFIQNAILNSKKLVNCKYEDIDWQLICSDKGNPSSTFHFLVEEIVDKTQKK